ncbi:MAG TPA: undecaprenyldiphospho-muramoylpentapeptide beta-N-acetylglucosaminyltransferase [Mycobacteriales bacterium]|nr:undecaprenyldiphospho-muramoylpentapeptide beta-N-acetylglucosaminyltransferase [Mycobacteriales bacterium]
MTPPSVVLAGGGSAGHISPALATADAVRRLLPDARITMLGTARGLETRLIPAAGYDLRLIPPVPLPRKPTPQLLAVPARVRSAVRATRAVLADVQADVVVGFGGYVALPAYLAARGRVPIVVHEANARPGLANRVGARFASVVAVAGPQTRLQRAQIVGLPLRRSVSMLDRDARRAEAREQFGLDPDRPTLLVTGGSQGARSINTAAVEAAPALAAAGIQVLHVSGPKNAVTAPDLDVPYVVRQYLDSMELGYAAADFALCRSGANTCAELTAVGLPAAYVPLPIGNGEQRLNAGAIIAAGGGLLVDDADLSADWVMQNVRPVLTDPQRLATMSGKARAFGHREADETLAKLIIGATP